MSKLSKNNQTKISQLDPSVQDPAIKMMSNLKDQGVNVEIVESLRTNEKQDEYYAKGRDKDGKIVDESKVITYLKGGESNHNKGIAFDVEVYDDKGKKDWNAKGENWPKVVAEGQKQGFTSGSTWTKPPDLPHFEKIN